MGIRLKRAYDPVGPEDGYRVLVDRLWPRGITKEDARLDCWAKEIAPSNELRKWYHRDSEQWLEFRRRYFAELDGEPDAVQQLVARLTGKDVTLVYSSNSTWNNAQALKEYLEAKYPEVGE